jgi:hypothetical protein
VCADTAVTLAGGRNCQRNEFANLRVEFSVFVTRFVEFAITANRVRADLANLPNADEELLSVGISVEHHRCSPCMMVGGVMFVIMSAIHLPPRHTHPFSDSNAATP